MAAPITVAHTHVYSIRAASGAEALVARVLAADGTAGFGFTFNLDAGVARDMAAWDASARSKGVPLNVLLGGSYRRSVKCMRDELSTIPPDRTGLRKDILEGRHDLLRIDPFAWGSVEMVQSIAVAASGLGIALLAPNAHPWEVQYCAALAAALKAEDVRIIVRGDFSATEIAVTDQAGLGIDWSCEPAFGTIQWLDPP